MTIDDIIDTVHVFPTLSEGESNIVKNGKRRREMKHMLLRKVPAVVAVALAVTMFTGGVAIAGSKVDQKARLELTPTGNFRHFEGDGKLELQVRDPYPCLITRCCHRAYRLHDVVVDPVDHSVECEVIASLSADLGSPPSISLP